MERVITLLEAVPYLRAYAGQTFVLKAGGELLEDARSRAAVARDVGVLHRLGIRVVFVHGGGPQLDAEAERGGLGTARVAGRRVTSPELLDAAVRVWRGALSTSVVAALAATGERAVGLSGVDGGLLRARRRPPALVADDDGVQRAVDYGLVGDVVEVSVDVVRAVLDLPAIPVVAPLAAGIDGEPALNVNADTVAAELAVALGAEKLVLLTRAPGIRTDPNDDDSVLHYGDLDSLDELAASGALSGGMRPKVDAIRRALTGGVPRAHVVDGRRVGALLEEVFTRAGSGTLLVAQTDDMPAEPLAP